MMIIGKLRSGRSAKPTGHEHSRTNRCRKIPIRNRAFGLAGLLVCACGDLSFLPDLREAPLPIAERPMRGNSLPFGQIAL